MTPLIDGQIHHFEFRGLYDGVTILADRETGSIWNHITGTAMYGSLTGAKMPVFNLLHMTVEQALAQYPVLEIAISDRPITGQSSRWSPWAERIPVLGRRFRSTMAPEDTRRPTMDVGLGVWTDRVRRYYPMEHIVAQDNVVLDVLDGRQIAVFFEPGAPALASLYVEATSARWDGDVLRFGSGDYIEDGVLYDAQGRRRTMDRPLQLFTRWYGYALTFPDSEVYEPEP